MAASLRKGQSSCIPQARIENNLGPLNISGVGQADDTAMLVNPIKVNINQIGFTRSAEVLLSGIGSLKKL